MLDFDTAQNRLVQAGTRPEIAERVTVDQARGRILANNVSAAINIPPADNSAMDGYAIRFADFQEGISYPIQQRVYAGDLPQAIQPGQAIRLFTGSLIPEGADTIVIQEDCTETDGKLHINVAPVQGQHVRFTGEDMPAGKAILLKGTVIGSGQIAILASQGVTEIDVFPVPKIGILTTGNELAEPGQPLHAGQIYNSNASMLASLVKQLGSNVVRIVHAADTLEEIQDAISSLAEECDLVLTVGGVSVGDKDLVKPAIEASGGDMEMWRVRMKPGKPVALARLKGTPIVGLPGNPVSAYAVFTLMVSPLIRTMQGRTEVLPPLSYGRLDSQQDYQGDREEFLRVKAKSMPDGVLGLTPHAQQGSSIISSLAWASGLARIPADTKIAGGSTVAYYDFNLWGY
ncbi:molybdopterin molybdotransferase MoeA [Paenalcaligenes niemegkensis]|uniref:molybdopterin molybdotransferase MoeA n=1 Tax=Paenalcaligenes niemegkensis TaxID=2895469 RepID=UPI001EE90A11|nr:molybdopterin molybdotransferase MoeA [Paenalcaligenes niemegkensis]